MSHRHRTTAAFTLIELLVVLVVIVVLVGAALPSGRPNLVGQLRAASRTVAADAAYARSLAVANNSKYRLRIDAASNCTVLEHSGTNTALANLPSTPYRSPTDLPTQQTTDFDTLLPGGMPVRLVGAVAGSQAVCDVEFGPLGQTTRAEATSIWLSAGAGSETLYASVTFDPVTGLAEIGAAGSTLPPTLAKK